MYIPFVFHRAAVQALNWCHVYIGKTRSWNALTGTYKVNSNVQCVQTLHQGLHCCSMKHKRNICPAECCIKACPLLYQTSREYACSCYKWSRNWKVRRKVRRKTGAWMTTCFSSWRWRFEIHHGWKCTWVQIWSQSSDRNDNMVHESHLYAKSSLK